MKLLPGNLTVYTQTPPYHDICQVRGFPDSTISEVGEISLGILGLYSTVSWQGVNLSPWMPGLYHFQGIDRIKMVDDHDVK